MLEATAKNIALWYFNLLLKIVQRKLEQRHVLPALRIAWRIGMRWINTSRLIYLPLQKGL